MGEILSYATFTAVVINLIVVAYSYGRLNQKVEDVCRRMDRVEKATFKQ